MTRQQILDEYGAWYRSQTAMMQARMSRELGLRKQLEDCILQNKLADAMQMVVRREREEKLAHDMRSLEGEEAK